MNLLVKCFHVVQRIRTILLLFFLLNLLLIKILNSFLISGDHVSSSSTKDQDYVSGIHTCVNEVVKFLTTTSFGKSEPEIKAKLLDHLANKLTCASSIRNGEIATALSSSPSFSCFENNVTSTNTGRSEDVNNNMDAISKPTPFQPAPVSPTFAPLLTQPPMLKTISPSQSVQPLLQVPQPITQSGSVPTVPVTILVPANICSASVGTTCVIPLTFSGQNPQLPTQVSPGSNSPSFTLPVIKANDALISPTSTLSISPNISISPDGKSFLVPRSEGLGSNLDNTTIVTDIPKPDSSISNQRPLLALPKKKATNTSTIVTDVEMDRSVSSISNVQGLKRKLQPHPKEMGTPSPHPPACDTSSVWRPW